MLVWSHLHENFRVHYYHGIIRAGGGWRLTALPRPVCPAPLPPPFLLPPSTPTDYLNDKNPPPNLIDTVIHKQERRHKDQGYGRGGTPIFTDVFEALARVALYPTDADGLGTCFDAP